MISNEGTNLIIQPSSHTHVLNTVLSHLSLCSFVSVKHVLPKAEPLVLHLTTNTQQGADISKTVHVEPKLLHCLKQVDVSNLRRRRKTSEKNLTSNLGHVVLVTVKVDDSISLVQ